MGCGTDEDANAETAGMKLSLSTKVLWSLDIHEALKRIKQQGYLGAEILVPHIWRDASSIPDFKTFLSHLDLEIMLHAPVTDLNITSTDPDIRRISIDKTARAIELAGGLEVEHLTIHPGRKSSTKDLTESQWEQQRESMKHLASVAESCGIRLYVENMEYRSMEIVVYPEDLERLMDEVGSDNLQIALDVAHVSTVKDIELSEYINRLRGFGHVHLSDSKPGRTHVPLGEGQLDLVSVVRELSKRYEGFVTIEGYVPGRELEVMEHNHEYWQELVRRADQSSGEFSYERTKGGDA
jgi:sugar phosphate isomerase/epimerase